MSDGIPQFLGFSTGRAGSRYFAKLLNDAGVATIHERNRDLSNWKDFGALGEVTAWLVSQPAHLHPSTRVWHFSRHPQPFVSSLIKFGFWKPFRYHERMHPFLRKTGDIFVDSYQFWIDWNAMILSIPSNQRVTFQIERIDKKLLSMLADSIGIHANVDAIEPMWNEKQEFAPIPGLIAGGIYEMMEMLGYA